MKKTVILFFLILSVGILPQVTIARSLAEIQKSGFIKIGTVERNSNPTYYYLNKAKAPLGLDVDLMDLIANELNVKAKIVKFDILDDRLTFLEQDKVDIVVSSFSITKERKEKIDFSIPYTTTGVGILLNKKFEKTIKNFEDLKKSRNISIMVYLNSTAHKAMQNFLPNINLLILKDPDSSWESFVSGQGDGFSTDRLLLRQYSNQFYLVEGTLTIDEYGVGINKKNINLRKKINEIIKKNLNKIEKIINKHVQFRPSDANKPPVENKPRITKAYLSDEYIMHTVVKGETLSKIAYKYFNDPTKWELICNANINRISSCKFIYPNQKIKIPQLKLDKNEDVSVQNSCLETEKKLEKLKILYEKKLITEAVFLKKQESLSEKYFKCK